MPSSPDMVKVAFARHAAEGELIRGLLEEAGIPSLLRPAGIDGPLVGVGFLPRSAQRVMVRPEHAELLDGYRCVAIEPLDRVL